MSLVTTKDLMLDAQKNHYAIGAFNAENMDDSKLIKHSVCQTLKA